MAKTRTQKLLQAAQAMILPAALSPVQQALAQPKALQQSARAQQPNPAELEQMQAQSLPTKA